jgi:hypothetical protein
MMLLSAYGVGGLVFVIGSVIVALARQRFILSLAGLITIITVFALTLTALAPGVYFNSDRNFNDFWTATETINKVHSGALSSVDYFNPIGPVYSYIYALLALIDPTPTAATVIQASALAGLIAALFSLAILSRQMSFLGLTIVVLSVVAVAISGRGNGELLHNMPMHYLAPYNRWGWALFIPVAIRLALPHNPDRFGAVALGMAIALLLMLKVTYGAAAIGLILARIALLPGAWRELPFVAVALAAVLVAIELTTGQVSAHLRDLFQTALLPESGLRLGKLFRQLGEAAIYIVFALVAYLATLRPTSLWADLRPFLLILLVAGAGCSVLMQNHYMVEAAVYPLLPLIALEWTGALRHHSGINDLRVRVLLAAAVAAMLFYPVIDSAMQVGQKLQFYLIGPDQAFANTAYSDLRFEPSLVENDDSRLNTDAHGRAGILEGMEMLRTVGADMPDAGSVATLSFSNPFPMFLGQRSPTGTPIWLHAGRSFSEETFVPSEIFFAGVGYVMSPSRSGLLDEIYATTLVRDFEIAARGEFWILHVRSTVADR